MSLVVFFCEVFPFGVVFNEHLTIIYVGRTLQKLFNAEMPARQQSRRSSASLPVDTDQRLSLRQNVHLIGQPLIDHFTIIRPQMTELTWMNVRLPDISFVFKTKCCLTCTCLN